MGLFRRGRGRRPPAGAREFGRHGFAADDREHLLAFLDSRRGVEAYLEPATTVTPWTVVLVAHDGEWTRRPCEDPEAARDLAAKAGIPAYDVAATGYPARMREWTSRQKAAGNESRVRGVSPRPTDAEMPPDPFL